MQKVYVKVPSILQTVEKLKHSYIYLIWCFNHKMCATVYKIWSEINAWAVFEDPGAHRLHKQLLTRASNITIFTYLVTYCMAASLIVTNFKW